MDEYLCELKEADGIRSFYEDARNVDTIAEPIIDTARRAKAEILSFDVFDTVLLREPKSEARRLFEMSERLVERCTAGSDAPPDFTAEDAFLARLVAAKAAYSMAPERNGNREGNFLAIATTVCQLLDRPDLVEPYLANELEYEAGSLELNPLFKNLVSELPDVQPVFVSDMYLESFRIEKLLKSKLADDSSKRVFSSVDGNGSKRSKGLFGYVEETLSVKDKRIIHLGDSLHSDYRMPKRHGWAAFYLPLPDAEKSKRRNCHEQVKSELEQANIPAAEYLNFNF